ncbi:MAG: hypothetical protein EAX96_01360 [Candidatus Lokiarchaeota archaeon]|nr:hypothetical protein [Candidatus Lokiarchaeota archaeon]
MSEKKKDKKEEEKITSDISNKYTKSPRKISEKEIESLKKLAEFNKGPELSTDEATVLDIISKRKFIDQITREVNLSKKPFGKELIDQLKVKEILYTLESKGLAKKIEVPTGIVWVSVEHIRYKALGSEKL